MSSLAKAGTGRPALTGMSWQSNSYLGQSSALPRSAGSGFSRQPAPPGIVEGFHGGNRLV